MKVGLEVLRIDPIKVESAIINFLRSMLKESGADGYIIGISGGLDSATVANLCVKAIGKEHVLGLIIPSATPKADIDDAIEVARLLGIEYEVLDITAITEAIHNICHHGSMADKVARGNVKARLRMVLLYYHANIMNRLVVGTSNKSELLIGYYTKYGDGGVDCLPIGNLYKTQVRQLANYIGIPKRIIEKVPTAGLWDGQTDEDDIGMKYEVLDLILYHTYDLGMDAEDVSKMLCIPKEQVERVVRMIDKNKHKRLPIPIAKF